MDVYQTEEEQVESIKKWWAKHSRMIMIGVGLGLFGMFGWQSWKDQVKTERIEASEMYEKLSNAVKANQAEAALTIANELESSYPATPYAASAALQKAKLLLEKGERQQAQSTLENVAATAKNVSIQHVARIRSFRIRIGDGDMQGVVSDIDSIMKEEKGLNPGEFIGQYEEVRGDAYRLLGDVEKARFGYIAAIRNATLDKRLIQMKLDDLGPPPATFGTQDDAANSNAE